MRKYNYHSEADLMQRLEQEIFPAMLFQSETAILAGHYAIDYKGRPSMSFESRSDFGIFPEYTFELGCQLLAKNKGVRLLLAVDDHSSMPDKRWYMDPIDPNIKALTDNYFGTYQIPSIFQEIMEKYGISEDRILPSTNGLAFQESWYRRKFVEHTSLAPSCSGEYRLILEELAAQGIRRLISFIPKVCQRPTHNAIGKYNAKKENPKLKIVHVHIPNNPHLDNEDKMWREVNYESKEGVILYKW